MWTARLAVATNPLSWTTSTVSRAAIKPIRRTEIRYRDGRTESMRKDPDASEYCCNACPVGSGARVMVAPGIASSDPGLRTLPLTLRVPPIRCQAIADLPIGGGSGAQFSGRWTKCVQPAVRDRIPETIAITGVGLIRGSGYSAPKGSARASASICLRSKTTARSAA